MRRILFTLAISMSCCGAAAGRSKSETKGNGGEVVLEYALLEAAGSALFFYRGDREEFFLAADRALYAAKAAGRDCVMTSDEADSRLEG